MNEVLCHFPQVEGFVIDRNLSLGNLMGTIADFYARLGPEFKDMKFKPTYNPYTEPSMEFHCFHQVSIYSYIYVYTYIHIYAYIYMHTYLQIRRCTCVFTYAYVYTYVSRYKDR